MGNKVYVIIGCFSGEDYSTDDPVLFEVCSSLEKAKVNFKNIITDYSDCFSDNCEYDFYNNEMEYEFTDFDNDEHGIIKIVEQTIKQ